MIHVYAIAFAHDEDQLTLPHGLENACYTVGEAGLLAVVSDADTADYRTLPPAEVAHFLEAHAGVIAQVAAETAVLPVQFGARLQDAAQVRQLLSLGQSTFSTQLRSLSQLAQVTVELLGQEGKLDAQDSRTHMALAQEQARLTEELEGDLAEIGQLVVKNPASRDASVVSFSALVEANAVEPLSQTLADFSRDLPSAYFLEISDIERPHRFHPVSVHTPKPHLVAHARELLGLGPRATAEEMRHAFKSHPHYGRPDQSSSLETILKMTELTQAYKLLKDYAESYPESPCRLDAAAVAEHIVVQVG